MFSSDEQLLSILAALEECRAGLVASGNRDSARLVAVAILDIRMKLNRIGDAELRALCEEMQPELASERARDPKSPPQRRRPLLRLVK